MGLSATFDGINWCLLAVWFVGALTCIERVAYVFDESNRCFTGYDIRWRRNVHTNDAVVVALVGFAIFPIVNLLFALSLWAYILMGKVDE